MAEINYSENGSSVVWIEDPDNVNINTNLPNAIPQYQDMHINAELTAIRRGRTVVNIGMGIKTDETLTVNFIGNNQNNTENNPNYLNFTTNYYDGSTSNNEVQYEAFGITSIKVVVNSSFVPQVNIQFLDVRGLSFFNQDKSPYRILFDFPPPIFNLRIKGYYGQTLEYWLHLVKYTSEFKAENGNFIIDAEFIALTFAPLTDILFRYMINTPMVNKNLADLSSKPEEPPINTYDFILKLKNLYSGLGAKIKGSKETADLKVVTADVDYIKESTLLLASYIENLKEKGSPLMFIGDVSNKEVVYTTGLSPQPITNTNSPITVMNSLSDYDPTIQSLIEGQDPDTITKRLYVGYLYNDITSGVQGDFLNAYKKKLTDSAQLIVSSTININVGDVKAANIIGGNNNIMAWGISGTTTYLVIDVTNYYVKLFRGNTVIPEQKNQLSQQLNTMINTAILETLGMIPTIYNVFKILLNDVDEFFKVLRTVAQNAENHHNDEAIKSIILSGIGNADYTKDKIYAFPLVMKEITNNCVKQQVRTSPKEISDKLPKPFPELDFIYAFMDTFSKQNALKINNNMKAQQDSDGKYKWIPISPIDSVLGSDKADSPYRSVNFSTYEGLKSMSEVLLNRFYILSEFAIPNSFYDKDKGSYYVDLYAHSEALNVVLSVNDTQSAENLKTQAAQFKNNPSKYFEYLDGRLAGTTPPLANYYLVNPKYVKDVGDDIYIDKNDPDNYYGVSIYTQEPITAQTVPEDITNPLYGFIKNVQTSWWKSIWNTGLPEASYSFTQQNTILISDAEVKDGKLVPDSATQAGVPSNTRFLSKFVTSTIHVKQVYVDTSKSLAQILMKYGNIALAGTANNTSSDFEDFLNIWASVLGGHGKELLPTFISGDTTCAMLMLSNFGFTLSPFNIVPNNIGPNIYQKPAVIESPFYLSPYVGLLIKSKEDGTFNEIANFFTGGTGKSLDFSGLRVFADYYDANTNLAVQDKLMYSRVYNTFHDDHTNENGFENIRRGIVALIGAVSGITGLNNYADRRAKYLEFLKTDIYYKKIVAPLMTRVNVVVNSENTFELKKPVANYVSLKTSNEQNDVSGIIVSRNKRFFTQFFTQLESELATRNANIVAKEDEQKKLKGDEDILNQLYYSFKNINDKWLTNPTEVKSGYPYNDGNNKLIDQFVFVDRAMNPIGDTIINPEILVDLADDPNVSIFSVISQLLSMNNFEFFPLQNFMTQNRKGFNSTFEIDPSGAADKVSAFMCMYIGGSSSYPTNIKGNGFQNDGIEDITTTDATDFSNCSNPNNNTGVTDIPVAVENNANIEGFQFKQVRAFRVKFGQQNQSMFRDIKIDSKEYPETNESIQILARLANDQQNEAPTPKGQNLYNLYENRAYSATITGLGNAMIQPTQYFQLDNVPMFNGAYLILSVEHNIQANNMTTSFTGTKILKYPIPRVTNPATGMGFEGSDTVGAFVAKAENYKYKINIPKDKTINLSNVLKKDGITNKNTISAIIGIAVKESGLVPKSESSYRNTGNERIRKIFGLRVKGLSENELSALKQNDIKFFDRVYGIDDPTGQGKKYGNTAVGDGYKYRGRGLNQLTYKSNYQTYSKPVGVDLVTYPDKANEIDIAYKILSAYFSNNFKVGVKYMINRYRADNINGFSDINTAYEAMYNLNAGVGHDTRYSEDNTGGKAMGRKATDDVFVILA